MKALYEDRDAAGVAAEKIKVFAQPQRLMILSCLLRGERNVGEIAEITGLVQPALSQQLGELRRSGLVQTRKEAKQVWYMLADESVALCVRNIEAIFAGMGTPQPTPVETSSFPSRKRQGVASFARIL
nr:metalloregulator ArsR/SmtB family transcription factor [Sphingomonas sp. CDS-1]